MDFKNDYKNFEFIFIVHKIDEAFGGLTKSMLDRAKLLNEEYKGINLKILSFSYHPDFVANSDRLYTDYCLPSTIKVMNLYQSLEPKSPNEKLIESWDKEDNTYTVEKVNSRVAYRYYKNGLYIKYKSYEKLGNKLKFIDFFNENRQRIKREEFDLNGKMRRVIYFHHYYNVPKQELYYTDNGHCYLSKWYKHVEEQNLIDRILLFDENSEIDKIFYSNRELEKYWVNQIINRRVKTFMIVDARPMDGLAMSIEKSDNLFKVFVTHSTHLREPYHFNSDLRSGNRAVLNNLTEVDAVVFLTDYQREDLELRLGRQNNLFVIPHSYQGKIVTPKQKDNKRVVSIGRYHKDKQLDHIIKAFKLVVQEVPDARLEFFGFGTERANMEKQIKQYNLESSIKINNPTETPYEEFANSAISILTSKYEGFGLVILESLANGAPVISYDIKYGPSDIIIDNETGVLIEAGNVKELAEKMIELLMDRDKLYKMSSNARKTVNRFSAKQFVKSWTDLFLHIVKQRELVKIREDSKFNIYSLSWLNNEENEVIISGMLYKSENEKSSLNVTEKYYWRFRNEETSRIISFEAEGIQIDNNKIKFKNIFSLKKLISDPRFITGSWNLSLTSTYNNFSFDYCISTYNLDGDLNLEKSNFKFDENFMYQFYLNPTGNIKFKITQINNVSNIKNLSGVGIRIKQAKWFNLNKGLYQFIGEFSVTDYKLNPGLDKEVLFWRMRRLSDNQFFIKKVKPKDIKNGQLIIDFNSKIFKVDHSNQQWEIDLIIENGDNLSVISLNKKMFSEQSHIDQSVVTIDNYQIKPILIGSKGNFIFEINKVVIKGIWYHLKSFVKNCVRKL